MSSFPTYDKGDWEALCDSCGRKFKASKLRLRWDGLRVCSQDYEVRHPQDFVRAKVDIQATPWTRPEPSDTFLMCTSRTSLSDFATADCMIADRADSPGLVPNGTFTP